MKNIVSAIAAVTVILVLAGCNTLSSGYVSDKVVEPENSWTSFIYVGKVLVPKQNIDDEDFCFTLTEGEESAYVCVSEEEWNTVEEGTRYTAE